MNNDACRIRIYFWRVKRMRKAQPKPTLPTSAGFAPNAFYEKVLDLRRTNPAAFDSLAPVTKLALAAYEAQQREAARLQALREEPAATHDACRNSTKRFDCLPPKPPRRGVFPSTTKGE